MSEEDFSPGQDPENQAYQCTADVIPILPVRFALLPYDNFRTPTKPTGIRAPGDYLLRLLRQGFVYIYIEAPEETGGATSRDGIWYNFRHMTSDGDANSAATPARVQSDARSFNRFVKYEWNRPYGAGDWTYSGETHGYCWVPKWASKIWIAYSEYAWPPEFFRKAHAQAYREKIMTPVTLRGHNEWAAMIGEAPELVEELKDPAQVQSTRLARLHTSQTGFESVTRWDRPISGGNGDCVALVAVRDPVGDIADMAHRSEQILTGYLRKAQEFIYPLTIGYLCDAVKDSVPKRDAWWDRARWANKPALAPGWQADYLGLQSMVENRIGFMPELTEGIVRHMCDETDHMIGKLLTLAVEAFDETDDPEGHIAEYYMSLLSIPLCGLATTQEGTDLIRGALGALDVDTRGLPGFTKWLGQVHTIWGAMKTKPFERLRQAQYSFQITFEAFAVPLSMQIAHGTQSLMTWQDALDAGFRQSEGQRLVIGTSRRSLSEALDLLQNNHDGARTGYTASDMAADMSRSGSSSQLRVTRIVNAGEGADVPFVRTMATMSFSGDAADLERMLRMEGRILRAEAIHQGLGIFLSSLALHNVVFAYRPPGTLFKDDAFTELMLSQGVQLASATASVAAAVHSSYKLLVASRQTGAQITAQVSETALETVLQRSGAVARTSATNVASAGTSRAARGAALVGKVLKTHGVVATAYLVGAATNVAGILRGNARSDRAEVWSNALMLIGGLLMFPLAGWLVASIGAVILGIGFLVSLGGYNSLEDIVRVSFWGSHDEYWGGKRPATKAEQVWQSRNLPDPYKSHFEDEVALFAELTWLPEITNPTDGDSEIIIRSGAIPVHGLDAVSVRVFRLDPASDMSGIVTTVPNFRRRLVPGTDAMVITIPPQRDEAFHIRTEKVRVSASVRGPRSGYSTPTVSKDFDNP
ncbi:MAG: hypothetical protein Q4G26_04390 [Paracoccus sp. (in: a-proteobacteria)]|nr:hypothetical protein [Paracoccus sp. (in: a-proteobacteria)]